MMKKSEPKKLVLSKQTLRALDRANLQKVGGAAYSFDEFCNTNDTKYGCFSQNNSCYKTGCCI